MRVSKLTTFKSNIHNTATKPAKHEINSISDSEFDRELDKYLKEHEAEIAAEMQKVHEYVRRIIEERREACRVSYEKMQEQITI